MTKIIDIDRDIDRDIDELVDFKAEVWEKLDKIADERYKRILWLRYADRKTWRYIALELNFTIRYIHKMHLKALAELDKINIKKRKFGHIKFHACSLQFTLEHRKKVCYAIIAREE